MAEHLDSPLPRTAAPEEVLAAALARLGAGERVAVATVLRRKGSAPSTPGQKLALLSDEALGTVGGGAVEQRVLQAMRAALEDGEAEPQLLHYDLGAKLGMCCGGSVEILVEIWQPALSVVVVGAGHVGSALAPLLGQLGFRVTLCDARDELAERFAAPGVRFVHGEHDDPEVRAAAGDDAGRAAALVMTHDHQLDQAAIEWALKQGFGFVGGVGSLAKAHRTRARLEARGFATEDVERMRMPLGIDIGARLPAEIAIAIGAELVRWRAELTGSDRRRRKHVALVASES